MAASARQSFMQSGEVGGKQVVVPSTPQATPAPAAPATPPAPTPASPPPTDRTDFQNAPSQPVSLVTPQGTPDAPEAPAAPVLLRRLPQGVAGLMPAVVTCKSPVDGQSVPGTLIQSQPVNPEHALRRTSLAEGDFTFYPERQDQVSCTQGRVVTTDGGHAYREFNSWTENQTVGPRPSREDGSVPDTVVSREVASSIHTTTRGAKLAKTADVSTKVLARGSEGVAISAVPFGNIAVTTLQAGAAATKHESPLKPVDKVFDKGASVVVNVAFGRFASPQRAATQLPAETTQEAEKAAAAAARATDHAPAKPK